MHRVLRNTLLCGLILVLTIGAYAFRQGVASAQSTESSFSPAQIVVGSSPPVNVVTADFNNDGKQDIATIGPDKISVVLGNGDGTFSSPITSQWLPVGSSGSPAKSVAADFNHDGKKDLAISNGTIRILIGNGDGSFGNGTGTEPAYYGDGAAAMSVSDFNRDGNLDTADVGSFSGGSALVTEYGTSTGTFNSNDTHLGIGNYVSLAVGDFNEDGWADIVTGNSNGTLSILTNNQRGHFLTDNVIQDDGLSNINSIVAADFNNDGHIDVAAANSSASNISVMLGNGNGTLSPPVFYSLSAAAGEIITGDFNQDGFSDLAFDSQISSSSTSVGVLENDGTGHFTLGANMSMSGPIGQIDSADFNGDGKADIVAAFFSAIHPNSVDVFLNTTQKDTTPPTITSSVSPQPNSNGWNNTDVTVDFNCSDADSGVATCTNPTTLTNEGANQTVTGNATDNAGNSSSTTATVNIDKTAPTISYTVTPSPNINGWNQDGVTVNFNCNDVLSGIDSCTSPVFISNEGANQSVTGTAVDKAGNMATVTATINVDKTAPTINYSTSPAPNSNGWNNSDVTVSFECSDALSGIGSCSSPATLSSEGANQTTIGIATDKAGNISTTTATVNIDKTAPTITANVSPSPDSNGWNNGDVTVTFNCSDALSGVDVCPSPITLSNESGGQIITGTATDKAGNSASTSVMVNIDKTAPTISSLSWLSNPLQQGQNTTLMATVSDSLSGISDVSYSINGGTPQPMSYDPISGNYIVTFGSTLPANTYSITVYAADAAGNKSSGTNDILAVYTTANGYVTGHAKVLPASSDTLPIALDTSNHPADLVMGFTNVTAPMSGSFDMDYSIKNNQNEFSISSTSIDWVVISDSTHASILGQADMAVWNNGAQTITQNVSVRYDIALGSNGSPDQVTVKIYSPGVNPNTGNPAYIISDQDEQNSNLMIHP